jgi:hypothetical protein
LELRISDGVPRRLKHRRRYIEVHSEFALSREGKLFAGMTLPEILSDTSAAAALESCRKRTRPRERSAVCSREISSEIGGNGARGVAEPDPRRDSRPKSNRKVKVHGRGSVHTCTSAR